MNGKMVCKITEPELRLRSEPQTEKFLVKAKPFYRTTIANLTANILPYFSDSATYTKFFFSTV